MAVSLRAVSAAAVSGRMAIDIIFYINLALVFCALVEAAAFFVLCKKTSCARLVGIVSVALLGLGLVCYAVQLGLFANRHDSAALTVYLCTAVLYCGFVAGGAYCIMLSRNSHKTLCIAACAFNFVPPVGALLCVRLSFRIDRDTRGQALVFSGYAYTYAALGEFCARNVAEFIDASGEMSFARLDSGKKKAMFKKLKLGSLTPEGQYEYAASLVHYEPNQYKKALKLMIRSADGGYAPAMFNLGYYYEMGAYVKQDYKRAKAYYRKAADAGDADAALRLGIIALKDGNCAEGLHILQDRVEQQGDLCAKYNIGVCAELGIGGSVDMPRAVEIYRECAEAGLFTAQKRIFSIAAKDINSAQNGGFFRTITDYTYSGTFAIMIDGLIEIKKRCAADAADRFLAAVAAKDKWEGVARCLVGTLYLDCGKLPADRKNGAEYIKSAIPLLPAAQSIYAVIPRSLYK